MASFIPLILQFTFLEPDNLLQLLKFASALKRKYFSILFPITIAGIYANNLPVTCPPAAEKIVVSGSPLDARYDLQPHL